MSGKIRSSDTTCKWWMSLIAVHACVLRPDDKLNMLGSQAEEGGGGRGGGRKDIAMA